MFGFVCNIISDLSTTLDHITHPGNNAVHHGRHCALCRWKASPTIVLRPASLTLIDMEGSTPCGISEFTHPIGSALLASGQQHHIVRGLYVNTVDDLSVVGHQCPADTMAAFMCYNFNIRDASVVSAVSVDVVRPECPDPKYRKRRQMWSEQHVEAEIQWFTRDTNPGDRLFFYVVGDRVDPRHIRTVLQHIGPSVQLTVLMETTALPAPWLGPSGGRVVILAITQLRHKFRPRLAAAIRRRLLQDNLRVSWAMLYKWIARKGSAHRVIVLYKTANLDLDSLYFGLLLH
jgi:hypothetical protein